MRSTTLSSVWLQPPRIAWGALLLEQGHVADAEAAYRADLGLDDSLVRRRNISTTSGVYKSIQNVWSNCVDWMERKFIVKN